MQEANNDIYQKLENVPQRLLGSQTELLEVEVQMWIPRGV